MNVPYMHYLESLTRLQEAARTAPDAEYLTAYNDCKAAKKAVRKQWINNAIIRHIAGKHYQNWRRAQAAHVRYEQRRYVEAVSKYLSITHLRSWN